MIWLIDAHPTLWRYTLMPDDAAVRLIVCWHECSAGDSERHDDWSTRLPAQWLERDGRHFGSCIALRRLHLPDDSTWTTQQLRYSAGVPPSSNTPPSQVTPCEWLLLIHRPYSTFVCLTQVSSVSDRLHDVGLHTLRLARLRLVKTYNS